MYTGGKTYPLDTLRATTLFVHTASPLAVMTGASLAPVDISRFATRITQSAQECTVGLSWHDELYGVNQPRAGQVLEIKTEGVSYWIGIIQAVNDYRLKSGEKSMSITARSRDATPAWRDVKRATDIYPTATPLAYIAKQIAQAIGLTAPEISLPDTGASTVQSNVQLADLSPWAMLTTLYQPAGLEPFVDCRGRLKCISRDIQRTSDIVLADNRRLVDVSGSKSRPPLTEMSIKWLDPNLTEVAQQDRLLDRANITAGFFQLHQVRDVFFSPDKTQRARDTHMVIKQSANSGLLSFCSEEYEQDSTTAGKIKLTTSIFAPGLATAAMVTKYLAHQTPDLVQTDVVTGTGVTIPKGRLLEYAADAVIMITMMSMGTGQYEIWGTPFDYVHARNTTTAYNPNANVWEIQPQEIENDFVLNESQAQAFAIRELVYAARSAEAFNVTIVDDTRIEPGDLIEISDGTRVYVTGYSRDLTNGAPAVLSIQGFVATINTTVGATQNVSPVAYPPTPPVVFPPPGPTAPPPVFPVPVPTPPPPPAPGPPPPPPLPSIYVPDVPLPVGNSVMLTFWMNRGTGTINPGVISIDTLAATGSLAKLPTPSGDPAPLSYGWIDWNDNGGTLKTTLYVDEEKLNADCTMTASGQFAASHPEFATSHAGECDLQQRPEFPRAYQWIQQTGVGSGPISNYSIVKGAGAGPISWDVYAGNTLAQIVRQDPGGGGSFHIRTGGIFFYRVNVLQSQGQIDAPSIGAYTVFIKAVRLFTVAGDDSSIVSPLNGDADDSRDPLYLGAGAFFGNGAMLVQAIGAPSEPWLRCEFEDSTLIAEYLLEVGQSGTAPRSWTLEASVNGVVWTVVDFQQNVVWADDEGKRFTLKNQIVFGDPP